ncbi:MAG: DNA-protecting protein DprA [Planctomycetaceae bacterium]|nr:DNA-protecting protein DprA [Planctomycetaceae bacterium]
MASNTTNESQLLDILTLNLVPGIGPRTNELLLEYFQSPSKILAATQKELEQVPGVGPKLAASIINAKQTDKAEIELRRCQENGFSLLPRDSEAFPKHLLEIPDAPNLLYCRGHLQPRDELAVAIVGSRRCTHYGRQQAEMFAAALARAGLTIVSGLARGIDACAHRGALSAFGRTIAVTATGLCEIYPPEHKQLAQEVAANGAIVTEGRLDQKPSAGLFPQRNRIISGMSLGVIVVEATRNSGALHTARHAMEQGREVMAIPGRVDQLTSEGCHDLIRDGATLITCPDDVLKSLGPLVEPVETAGGNETVHSPRELTLNDREREILNLVTTEPQHIDEILRASDIEPARVLSTLTVLEMKRMIRRLPGGSLVRSTY